LIVAYVQESITDIREQIYVRFIWSRVFQVLSSMPMITSSAV